MKTLTSKEFRGKLEVARLCPGMAHLPSFGLMAPRNWDYYNPELLLHAAAILTRENIKGLPYESAPALFWYATSDGDIHCHDWE